MEKSISFALLMIAIGTTAFIPVKAQDLVYVAVDPCRIVDTRNAGGAIPANAFRNFRVSGTVGQLAVQGGTTNCLDPKAGTGLKPLAMTAYVVAVPAPGSSGGALTAYPSNLPPPPPGSAATVNFAAGQVIGNTTIITLCDSSCPTSGEFAILARNTPQHVVIDVQGYFYPQVLNVGSVIVSTQSDGFVGASSVSDSVVATCPTGWRMSGGGVTCSSDNFNASITNYGVINFSAPAGDSYIGSCVANALVYSSAKFGPPVTAYAVCLYDTSIVPAQAASTDVVSVRAASVSTGADTQSEPTQGEPSEEALLLLESLRKEAAEREALVNSTK